MQSRFHSTLSSSGVLSRLRPFPDPPEPPKETSRMLDARKGEALPMCRDLAAGS